MVVRNQINAASVPSVTAVRASVSNILFSVETHRAVTAAASL